MYRNEYEKALEQVKTAVEFARDCSNISRCETNMRYFNRGQAMSCLQDMIREYVDQINTFGLWIDGVRVVHGVPLEQFSDMHIEYRLCMGASDWENDSGRGGNDRFASLPNVSSCRWKN